MAKEEFLLSTFLFSVVLAVLVHAVRQEKSKIQKLGRIKYVYFVGNMIVYIDSPNLNLKVNSQSSFYLSCQFILSVSPSLKVLHFTRSPPSPTPCPLPSPWLHLPHPTRGEEVPGPSPRPFLFAVTPLNSSHLMTSNTVHVLTSNIVPTSYLKLFRIFKWCSLPPLQLILNYQSSKPSTVFLFHLLQKPDALH